MERDPFGLRELPGKGPQESHCARGPLPNDVHQGGEEGLHLVAEAVLGTQRLHQRGHLAVVVPRHRGEEAGRDRGTAGAGTGGEGGPEGALTRPSPPRPPRG